MKKLSVLLMIFVLNMSFVCAVDYYADLVIDVADNGDVQISGETNHPELQEQITQDYTSKDKSYWTFDMAVDDIFSEYVYEIRFPKYAVVNYIKIPSILSMGEEDNRLVITSVGKNTGLRVIAQYSFDKEQINGNRMLWYSIILFMSLLSCAGYYLYTTYFKKKPSYNLDALTPRQKQIFNLILKNNGSVTQSFLQKEVDIPKASLSRNIDSLIRRKLVEKEAKGMTNLIFIKKE